MEPFDKFRLSYPDRIEIEYPNPAIIIKYRSLVPSELITFWKEHGWSGYNKGLFWIVNPDYYEDIIHEWVDHVRNPVVIAKTAFADLFIWMEDAVYLLEVQNGELTDLDDDIVRFFDLFLCDDELTTDIYRKHLFAKAYKKLGSVLPDTCYGFVPVLALGGSENAETIQKVKIIEYLYFLSQLQLGD